MGKILYVVNVDWFFLSHRLGLAKAAQKAGWTVVVAAHDTGKAHLIREEGMDFFPIPVLRKGINPFSELRTLFSLISIYRRVKPDILHHVTIKPVIYGTLASHVVPRARVVNAITGLGFVFTKHRLARFLRPLVLFLYRLALRRRNSATIFQNQDDLNLFVRKKLLTQEEAVLIRGSGVDPFVFAFTHEPSGPPLVLFASRMLWDKGIGDFVEAARLLRSRIPSARFVLVGSPDLENPMGIPEERLKKWHQEGIVEWWGPCFDMPQLLSQCHLVVLPTTYPEGIPRILIEAASAGRALVATDAPGCREIIRSGVNGLLVKPKDSIGLASALETLLKDARLRSDFGKKGREMVLQEFTLQKVNSKTLLLYERLFHE